MSKWIMEALLMVIGMNLFAQLSDQWQIFFFNHENATENKQYVPVSAQDGVVTLLNEIIKPVTLRNKDGLFDLDKLSGNSRNGAVLVGNFFSKSGGYTWLGVGCRVFAVRVNGKTVYDFLGKGLGNDYDPVSAGDHIFRIPLNKGDNEIQIETYRSNWKLDYCYGKDRRNQWNLAVREWPDHQPVKAELAHPELLFRPDIGSVMIIFITKEAVPGGVDYRIRGGQEWIREWDTAGDLILREKSRIHKVRLTGLKPGTEYEYRIVLLEPPAGLDGFKRALWSPRNYREVFQEIKQFRTFGHEPDFRFWVLGDTQLSLSTGCRTVPQRMNFMRVMQAMPGYKKADFIVHMGDLDSYSHDIEKSCFTDFFDGFSAPADRQLPWVYVRGNHEPDGLGAEDWYDYFQMPGERSYYAFRRGEVLFIVLDCGDFNKNPLGASNGPLLALDNLFRKQTKWLEQLRKTPEFRSARFRVVLSHSEPQIEIEEVSARMRKMTGEMLADQSPEGIIQLWIAGHVHYYWRANRGSAELISRKPVRRRALPKAPVNWVSVDAPKGDSSKPDFSYLDISVNKDSITVSALDENGREFDRFSVDQKGNVSELFQSPELNHYSLEAQK